MITHLQKLAPANWDDLLLLVGQKLLYCLLVYAGLYLLKRLVKWGLRLNTRKFPILTSQDLARQQTLGKLLFSLIDYVFFFLTGYWFLLIWGFPISSLLAGAGLAGLAIGLGAQGFLNDLINGLFILIERQYDVGDKVKLLTISGTVTNLGIRTTQILDSDGTVHFIPNRNITLVSNLSRQNMRVQIDLPLDFSVNSRAVTTIIQEVNQTRLPQHPEVLQAPLIKGHLLSDLGNNVFRVELLVANGQQKEAYQAFYNYYQEALRKASQDN